MHHAQPVVRIAARDKDDGTKAGQEIDHFHAYVRPAAAPTGEPRQLSEFCTSLTHITQSEVDVASPLDEVLEQLEAWLQERGLVQALEQGSAVLVAHGEWDLRDQLPRECARKGITLPSYFNTHTDLKTVFALTHTAHRGTSLKQMADFSGIKLEGRAHCGLDEYARSPSDIATTTRAAHFPVQCVSNRPLRRPRIDMGSAPRHTTDRFARPRACHCCDVCCTLTVAAISDASSRGFSTRVRTSRRPLMPARAWSAAREPGR
jgi:inhibitor of KinA sporulation pathway (predicted exonuclease)